MKNKQTHVPHAIIAGVLTIVLAVVLYITNLSFETWASLITSLPLLVMVIINANAYSKANNHYVTFGNVFTSGFKLSLIMAVIMLLWGAASLFIFPEMKDKIIESSEQKMLDQGQSEEQIEMGLKFMKDFYPWITTIGLAIGQLFWGTLFSLIGGAVAKKKGERPFGMDQA